MSRTSTLQFKYAPGSALVVPDALGIDSVEKLLCQRCYKEIPRGAAEETAMALMDVGLLGGGPSSAELREAQREQLGDVCLYARGERNKGYHVYEAAILRKQASRQAALVVPDELVARIVNQGHRSRLFGHYGLRRILKRLHGLYWWKRWRWDVQEKLVRCVACTACSINTPSGRGVCTARPRPCPIGKTG